MKKKFIVVTGVTRGLGAALAAEFISSGQRVAGCGRSESPEGSIDFESLDVTDDNAVAKWARRVIAKYGAPDLLLNNAAIINQNAPLWEVPAAEFDKVIDINIKGVVNVIRHFVPAMVARGEGIIVNFSSGWGRSVDAQVAPYCATKWAIEGLSKALALELPAGMASVPLNPGIIDTDMLRSCFGSAAGTHPAPKKWAKSAAPFILNISGRDNGQSLTVN